jgi:hypothetical protein
MSIRHTLTRRSFHQLLAGTVALVTGAFFGRSLGRAAPSGTWTLYAPCNAECDATYPYCASDYYGHPDNALDFGGPEGRAVQVYFSAGPYTGYAKVTEIGDSCSSAYFTHHRRVEFELYDDCSRKVPGDPCVASHVTTTAVKGQIFSGAGGAIASNGGGSGVCNNQCWCGAHVHYGAPGMSKLVNWYNGSYSAQAGKTACWDVYLSGC